MKKEVQVTEVIKLLRVFKGIAKERLSANDWKLYCVKYGLKAQYEECQPGVATKSKSLEVKIKEFKEW